MSFFTLRKIDEDFFNLFDGELINLNPGSVMLNGLDDKIYEIRNKEDIYLIGPYQQSRQNKTLQNLLPLKGTVKIRFIRLISQGCRDESELHFSQYKELWNDFLKVLYVVTSMQIECDDDEMSIIHYRVLSTMTELFEYNNLQELAEDLIEPY